MKSSKWNPLALPFTRTMDGLDAAGYVSRALGCQPDWLTGAGFVSGFTAAGAAAALLIGACTPASAALPRPVNGPALIRSLTVGHSGSMVSLSLVGDRSLQARITRSKVSGFLDLDIAGKPLFHPSRTHIGIGGVDTIRSGWFSARPPALRVIVESKDDLHYQLQRHNTTLMVLLWSGSTVPSGKDLIAPAVRQPDRKIVVKANDVPKSMSASAVVVQPRTTAAPKMPARSILAPKMTARYVAPVPATAPAIAPLNAASPVFMAAAPTTNRVSRVDRSIVQLNLKGANLVDVLKALADQTGTNIVIASGVAGTVTIDLRNVTVDSALDLITKLNNLSYRRENNTIVVGTEAQIKEMFDNHLGPVIMPVNQAVPAELVAAITKNFPDVQANAEGPSQIVLSGPSVDVMEAEKLVAGLDGPPVSTAATPVLITLQVAKPADVLATLTKLYPRLQAFAQGSQQILITGNQADVESAVALVKGIDVPSAQMPGIQTVTYESRYANVYDLVRILGEQVPQVTATPGPGPQFSSATSSSGAGAGASMPSSTPSSSSSGSSSAAPSSGGAAGGAAGTAGGGSSLPSGGAVGSTAGSSGTPQTSILLLTGTRDAIATARTVLATIDVPKPSVRIEARVIDVNLDHTSTTGVTWSFSQGFSFGELSPPAASPLGIFPFKGGPLSRPNISATMDLLASDSHNKVLASPTITAVSDEPSNIFIGDEITYVSNVDRATNGAGTFQTSKVDVGITLQATGHVSPDGSITLNIAPNVSVLTALAAGANGAQLPLIAQRRAQTVMRVRSGQTIEIGGLIRDEDLAAMEKVPILSNLPFLGELFKHRSITHHRSEVVIFLRATALPADGSAPVAETPLPGAPPAETPLASPSSVRSSPTSASPVSSSTVPVPPSNPT